MSRRTNIIARLTPKSTTHEPSPESGSTSRGKNTFEIRFELPTRQLLTLLRTLLKKFQPSKPANENDQVWLAAARQTGHRAEDE